MEYSATFDTIKGTSFTASTDNPAAAESALAKVFSGEPEPLLAMPTDGRVTLPIGLLREDGELVTRAQVRELTGADEEKLAKAQGSALYLDTLVHCGTESIGGEPATLELLRSLTVPDLNTLLLGIRIATFGKDMQISELVCPHCNEATGITVHLDQITIRPASDRMSREFPVTLRDDTVVWWRRPIGADQLLLGDGDISAAEQSTLLLSRCVVAYVTPAGQRYPGSKTWARGLGIQDRRTILDAITEEVPGPVYDELSMVHDGCGKGVPILVTVWDLFRG